MATENTRVTVYRVIESYNHDGCCMGNSREQQFGTLEEAQAAYADIDVAGRWCKEYRSSRIGMAARSYEKTLWLCTADAEWLDEVEYIDCIESEEYGYKEYTA